MVAMFNDCKLVHGDLSEFNLLYSANKVYVIDVAQVSSGGNWHSFILWLQCTYQVKLETLALGPKVTLVSGSGSVSSALCRLPRT